MTSARLRLERADLHHLWAFLRSKSPSVPQHAYHELLRETVSGRVFALVNRAGVPVAIGGVARVGTGLPGIAWLDVGPCGFAGCDVFAVRVMRRGIALLARQFPEGVSAFVLTNNPEGARLARLVGLAATDNRVLGWREWRHGCTHRQDGEETGAPG